MRFLGSLFLLAVVLAAIGFVRGWFFVDTVHGATGERTRVTVDERRVDADLEAASKGVARLSQQAKEIITGKAIRGDAGALMVEAKVLDIEAAAGRLQVRIEGASVLLDVPRAVAVVVGGAPATLADLQVGSSVQLTIEADGDELCLRRVATL